LDGVSGGTGRGNEHEGSLINGRHPHRKVAFALVVLACWIVGLFGLDRGRMSSFQLPIVVLAGCLGYMLVGAIRRKVEDTRSRVIGPDDVPPGAVVIRRFGEERRAEYPAVKILQPEPIPPHVEPPERPERRLELVGAERDRSPRRRRSVRKQPVNYIPLTGI
jgi:hypothetical protein